MEHSPKYNFASKKNTKMATAALVTTIAIMGGISTAQNVKNEADQVDSEKKGASVSQTTGADAKKVIETLDQRPYEAMIQQLTSDEYKLREEAHELVWKQGKKIIPALEKAVESDDPEIAVRAADILRNLRIGVTHDTPKHIADKVAEFQTALLDKQDDILRFLYQERAYNQMIYMLAEMENREDAEKLHKNLKQLPYLAAKEELLKDNVKGAIELLKMCPQTDQLRRSLAFVYARTGLAQAEYERLSQLENLADAELDWSLMLLQEMDDHDKLREFAHQNDIRPTLDVLSLLDGNAIPLLDAFERKHTEIQALGAQVIKAVYAGEPEENYAGNHVKLLELARKQLVTKQFMPANILFLSGGERLGESILLQAAPTKAFSFLDERERPVEALAALGLTNEASIIKWRDTLIADLLADKVEGKKLPKNGLRREQDVNYMNEEQLILEVASLYVRHGATDKAKLILDPLMTALHKLENNEHWTSLIADLPRYNMHALTMHYILESAKDDEIAQMIDILFDGTESVNLVWKQLLRRKKEVKASFKDMSILMGMHRGVDKERGELEAYLIKASQQQGLDDLRKMQLALYYISDFRYDSLSASKYHAEVIKVKADEQVKRARVQDSFDISVLNLDWKNLLKMFEENPEFGVRSSEWLTIRSIAERELGNNEKADSLLDKAMLLTVGQGDEINEILSELIWAGDMQRSNTIIERELIIHSDATEAYPFIRALGIMADGNSHYLISGQWKKAAALAYASNLISMTYVRDTMSEPNQLLASMKMNFVLNFARGMEFHQAGEHEKAKRLLNNANQCIVGDGALADIFYPAVLQTEYKDEYAGWVKKSHDHLNSAITDFPNAANTRNTLAWILSRSVTSLDEGIKHSEKALELSPNEAAYLDTMAELWFAKGDRKKAIEWGNKAVKHSKSGRLLGRASQITTKARTLSLYGQLKRFKKDPMPAKQ